MEIDITFAAYLKKVSELDLDYVTELLSKNDDITSEDIESTKLDIDNQKILAKVLMEHFDGNSDPTLYTGNDIAGLSRKVSMSVPDLEKFISNYQKWKNSLIKNKGIITRG
jgi:hypothetical protein